MTALIIISWAAIMALGFGFQEAVTTFQRQQRGDTRELPHTKLALLRIAVWALGATAILLAHELHWHALGTMALLTYGTFTPVHRLTYNWLRDRPWWYMGPKLQLRRPGASVYDALFHRIARAISTQPSPYYQSEMPGQLAYALELAVLIATTATIVYTHA
jgi:hypothetical protein